jgi:DNA (cytosine-5)-methyltransferase 1
MSDLRQVGFIGKNVQGNRVYDAEGISATLASQTGGLGGTGAGVYLINENLPKGSDNLTNISEVFEGKPFTYVSLFSGVGGFEQALNKLGGKCIMASEIDKFANKAYEVLYGEPTVGDVTEIEAEDVPDHDLLVGGFPCQAFSVAGKRLGFEDTRGTLFFEMARIAKAKKPKVILAENVKGLVGHDKGRTLNVIIQTLCDIGYTVDFNVLNSKYFGVPQNRERIFIVAVRDDLIEPSEWNVGKRTDVVAKGKRRISQLDGVKTFNFDWPPQTEVATRLRDILEDNVDERFYLSEEKTARLIAELDGKEFSDNDEPEMVGRIDLKGHDAIKRVYSPNGVGNTLTTMGGGHREPKIAEVRPVLTPDRETKRQNGRRFKDDGEESFTLTAQDRHGVAIGYRAQLEEDIRNIVSKTRPNEEIAITFKDNGDIRPHRLDDRKSGISELNINHENNPSFTVTSSHAPKVYGSTTKYRIRKLTPRECFRLQGFPDSEFDKLVAAGISNSQLYKMAGNAVTVNVIDAIGRRLLAFLN